MINTELDNSGFEKGSDKLLAAMKDLTSAVDTLGDNTMSAFRDLTPTLQAIGKNTSQIYAAMASGGDEAIAANEKVAESFSGVSQAAQGVAADIGKEDIPKEINASEKAVSSLSGQIERLSDRAKSGFKTEGQLNKFSIQVDRVKQRISELRAQMGEMSGQQLATPDYAGFTSDLEKATTRLNSLLDRQNKMDDTGVKKTSKAYQSLAYDIGEAKAQIAALEGDMASMREDGTAFISVGDTEQFQRTSAAIDELAAKANALPHRATGLKRFGEIMGNIGKGALKVAGNIAKITFTGIKKGLSGLASATKAVASGAKTALGHMLKLGKGTGSAGISAKGLTKQLVSLKTMLLTRAKSALISSLVDNIKSGISGLAKFSPAFDSAMSNIKNSMGELGANISVTLGGAIQKIEPIITAVINSISNAVTGVNALLAQLSGESTMTVAKKQTDSYADSLDGASKSAKKLNAQVYGFDKLNKRSGDSGSSSSSSSSSGAKQFETKNIGQTVPTGTLDLIDKIRTAITGENWLGLGDIVANGLNGVISGIDGFINTIRQKGVTWTVAVASTLTGLFTGIDWDSLGTTVGDGINALADIINTAFTAFDFTGLGDGVGKALNGLFDSVDWTLLGETFANKWNALVDLILGFIEAVDWTKAGNSAAEFLNSYFGTIDWEKLGTAIGKGIDGLIKLIFGTINGIDWISLGKNVGTGVMAIWNSIDWANAGKLVSDGIIGILDGISAAIESIDWQKLGSDTAVFIGNIDWSGVFTSLSHGIGAALGGLAGFLWGLIKDAWGSMVDWWKEVAYEDGEFAMEGLLKGIGDVFVNIGQWIKDNIFTPFMDGFKKAFGIHSPSTEMATMGGYLVEGLKNGITNGWESLKSKVSEKWTDLKNDVSSKWNGLKTMLQSTSWSDIGSNLVSGLKSGISSAWNGLKTGAKSLADGLTSSLKNAFDIHSPSKVWAKLGKYLPMGLEVGIENGAPSALAAVSNLAADVNDRMQIDAPAITDSGVGNRLQAIANMLSSVGGLQIPSVAAGTSVPYGLRTSTPDESSGVSGLSEGLQTMLSDQSEYSTEIIYLLRKILGLITGGGKTTIDASTIAAVVSTYQSNRERSFGGAY